MEVSMKPKPKKLKPNDELALRITEHLLKLPKMYHPNAHARGKTIHIVYVTYQGTSKLTTEQATAYLAALDNGYKGTHASCPEVQAVPDPLPQAPIEILYVVRKEEGYGRKKDRLVIYPVRVMSRGKTIKVIPNTALHFRTFFDQSDFDRMGVRSTPEDAVTAYRRACQAHLKCLQAELVKTENETAWVLIEEPVPATHEDQKFP